MNLYFLFEGFQSRFSHLHGMPARNTKKAPGNQNALVCPFIDTNISTSHSYCLFVCKSILLSFLFPNVVNR